MPLQPSLSGAVNRSEPLDTRSMALQLASRSGDTSIAGLFSKKTLILPPTLPPAISLPPPTLLLAWRYFSILCAFNLSCELFLQL